MKDYYSLFAIISIFACHLTILISADGVDQALEKFLSQPDNQAEQILDELNRLAEREKSDQGTVSEKTANLLEAHNFSQEKCNADSILKINGLTRYMSRKSAIAIKPYIHHCITGLFMECKPELESRLDLAVRNLTKVHMRHLELALDVFSRPYNLEPEDVFSYGFDDAKKIGEGIPLYFDLKDKQGLLRQLKSKPLEETIIEQIKQLFQDMEDIYQATTSAFDVYQYAGSIKSARDLFNVFEMEWISKLKVANDVGYFLEKTIEYYNSDREDYVKYAEAYELEQTIIDKYE